MVKCLLSAVDSYSTCQESPDTVLPPNIHNLITLKSILVSFLHLSLGISSNLFYLVIFFFCCCCCSSLSQECEWPVSASQLYPSSSLFNGRPGLVFR